MAWNIYTDVMKTVSYEIYTKSNSFKDDDGKASLQPWTLVKKGDIMGAGQENGYAHSRFRSGKFDNGPERKEGILCDTQYGRFEIPRHTRRNAQRSHRRYVHCE
jgi:hypothetical protein